MDFIRAEESETGMKRFSLDHRLLPHYNLYLLLCIMLLRGARRATKQSPHRGKDCFRLTPSQYRKKIYV